MNSGDDSTGADADVQVVNPWEDRKDRGRASALVATLRLLATSPRMFFEGTRPDTGIWGPLLFMGLITMFYLLLKSAVLVILTLTLPEPALDLLVRTEFWVDPSRFPGPEELPFGATLIVLIGFQALLFLAPFLSALTLIYMLIVGALVHLLLIVTRTPRTQGFRGTWAVICYANGASLLGIVPFAGQVLAVLCSAALFGLGLHVVQRVGAVRAAVLAAILPFLALLSLLGRLAIPDA